MYRRGVHPLHFNPSPDPFFQPPVMGIVPERTPVTLRILRTATPESSVNGSAVSMDENFIGHDIDGDPPGTPSDFDDTEERRAYFETHADSD